MSRLPPRLAAVFGALALALPAAAQPTLDHLACFKVKDHTAPATYSFSLTNAAGTQNCVAKLPAKFGCFESAESNVVPHTAGPRAVPGSGGRCRPLLPDEVQAPVHAHRRDGGSVRRADGRLQGRTVHVHASEPWASRRRADEHNDHAATSAVPFHRWPVPGTVQRGRGVLGGGVERLVRVPDDALRAGGRAHLRRLLQRPEQGVRLQRVGLQLRAHPVSGDIQRDATAISRAASVRDSGGPQRRGP